MANALTTALDELAQHHSPDYAGLYGETAAAQLSALDAQYAAQLQALNERYAKTGQAYETARSKANDYANLSAIGNNEAAGNAYGAAPRYSQTSHMHEQNALANALNNAYMQQANVQSDINSEIAQAGLNQQAQAAALMSMIDSNKLAALQQENQFASNNGLQRSSQEEAASRFNEQLTLANQQNAMNQAYQELKAFGRIKTQAAADALGVKVGTTLGSLKGKRRNSKKPVDYDANFEEIVGYISTGQVGSPNAILDAYGDGLITENQKYTLLSRITHGSDKWVRNRY